MSMYEKGFIEQRLRLRQRIAQKLASSESDDLPHIDCLREEAQALKEAHEKALCIEQLIVDIEILYSETLSALYDERQTVRNLRDFIGSAGKVYGPNNLFLRTPIGDAEDVEKNIDLEMSSIEPMRAMAVRCKQTGKMFVMDWSAVCHIAVRNGVAEVDAPSEVQS